MKIVLKGMVQGILYLCCFCIVAQQKTETPKGLDPKEESIVKIASLTAQGELDKLALELAVGLDNGLSVNEIKEVIVHLYAYCGFPRSIRGLQTFLDVLEERKNQGVTDNWGKEAKPINDTRSKYDRGVETLEELILAKMDGPKPAYQQFSPEMDMFLKEHLFADLFERDVLTYQQRELTTISVIASLGGLDPMLRSHLSISMNMGLTPKELKGFVELIATTAGEKKAAEAHEVLTTVLEAR